MTIHLAPKAPIRCAGCFNQQTHLRHVDFDSALDRGYGNEEAIQISMDEAIFCENCVRVGAELIGMTAETALKAENDELRRKVALKDKLLKQAQRYADTLEDGLVRQREKPIHVDHRQKPRKLRDEVIA